MLHRPGGRCSSPWPAHGSVVQNTPVGSIPSPCQAISWPPADIVSKVCQHFGYAIDKRYLPVLLPFLCARKGRRDTHKKAPSPRPSASSRSYAAFKHHWCAHHPELPLVDGVWSSHVTGGRRLDLWNEPRRRCMHSLRKRVPSPFRRSGHSALTVTVADLEGLTAALGGDNEEPAPSA